MPLTCSAKGCKTTEGSTNLSFFSFPEDEETCRLWVLRSGRLDFLGKNAMQLHNSAVLCERHFDNRCFEASGKKLTLKPKAKPSIFDHGISTISASVQEEAQLDNVMGPVVVIPVYMENNEENAITVGYEDDMVKVEGDDRGYIDNHQLQLMHQGAYIETEVVTHAEESMDGTNELQTIEGKADIMEISGIVVEDTETIEHVEWAEDQAEYTILVDNLCRICANEDVEFIPVFGEKGREMKLPDKIGWYLPIVVKPDDKLPLNVCIPCVNKLNTCHELINLCAVADTKLRSMFGLEDESGENGVNNSGGEDDQIIVDADNLQDEIIEESSDQQIIRTSYYPQQTIRQNIGKSNKIVTTEILSGEHVSFHSDGNETGVGNLNQRISRIANAYTTEDIEMNHEQHVKTEDDLMSNSKDSNVSSRLNGTKSNLQLRVAHAVNSESMKSSFSANIQELILKQEKDAEGDDEEEDDDDDEDIDDGLHIEWNCSICGFEAASKSDFILHQRQEHADINFSCSYCGQNFTNEITKRIHENSHSIDDTADLPIYVCEYCGESFHGKKALKDHHITNHTEERPYKCDECNKSYGTLSSLDIHKATHSTETPYLCDLCGKSFKHINNLRSHKRSHLDENDKNRQVCHKCGKGFRSRFHLSEHLNVHNGVRPYVCDKCGKRFHKKIQLRQHGSAHLGSQPFKCPICGVRFNRRGNMTQHIKRHDQERKYTCKVCNVSFPTLGAVLNHRKQHTQDELEESFKQAAGSDGDESPFKCHICGKLLAKKESLNTHLRSHTGEKLFECTVCGKKLSNKGSLTYHMRSFHTGERPHTCQYCGEGFLSKETRLVHERIHTGEKPYKCSICPMAFRCSSNLAQHVRVHSEERPYPCSHCGKAFQRKGALDVHMRTHTGERPYVCDICGRGFTQKNDMLKHRRTHTNDKLFRCPECGEVFGNKRDLTKHSALHSTHGVQDVQQQPTLVITTTDNLLTAFPEINVPAMENTQTVILHRF